MKKVLYLDTEWANSRNKSICQIGLISEDLDTGEPVLPELNLYLNPEDNFDDNCIAIHHITADNVKDSMTFKEAWPKLEPYFVNSILIGHNIKGSDLDAIVRSLKRYDIDIPELWFLDTYDLSTKLISTLDIKNYKLPTLCDFFGIDIDNEHDAFDDACACADLLKEMIDVIGCNIDNYVEHYTIKSTCKFVKFTSLAELRREINTLYGILTGIGIDGVINQDETDYIINWRKEHDCYIKYNSVKHIMEVLDVILEDNIVTMDELNTLRAVIALYLQEVSASKETLATQQLQGMLLGIDADRKIRDEEILELQKWLYENSFLEGHFPYDKLVDAIESILEDGIITEDERLGLEKVFDEINNPLEELKKNLIDFEGKSFCLSGNFNYGSKDKVKEYIESKGGTIDKSVKKSTNYVIVGGSGSDRYSNGNYGTKVKKAIEKGITVLKEEQIFE